MLIWYYALTILVYFSYYCIINVLFMTILQPNYIWNMTLSIPAIFMWHFEVVIDVTCSYKFIVLFQPLYISLLVSKIKLKLKLNEWKNDSIMMNHFTVQLSIPSLLKETIVVFHNKTPCNTWGVLDTEIQNLDLQLGFERFDKVMF